jgi:hypothetical protein
MKHKKQLRKLNEDAKYSNAERASSGEYSGVLLSSFIHNLYNNVT